MLQLSPVSPTETVQNVGYTVNNLKKKMFLVHLDMVSCGLLHKDKMVFLQFNTHYYVQYMDIRFYLS